jgi:predicted nucleotidyltransferase
MTSKEAIRISTNLSDAELTAVKTFVRVIREKFFDRIIAVALFGSKARGDDHPESDIDLIVITDSEEMAFRSALWQIASEISLEYNVLISARIYGKNHWDKTRQLGLPISKIIISESIPLTPEPIPM